MDETHAPKAKSRRTPSKHGGRFARVTAWLIFLGVTIGYLVLRTNGKSDLVDFVHRFVLRDMPTVRFDPPNLDAFMEVRGTHLEILWHGVAEFAIKNFSERRADRLLKTLSCVCGGLSASLLFASVRCMILLFLRGTYHKAKSRKVAAWIGGVVAAGVLAVNQPAWIAVGWLRPELFDLAIMMVAVYSFVYAAATGRSRYLCVYAFLYGLMLFETGDLIRLLPFFLVFTLVLLARMGQAHLRQVLILGGLFLLGACLYLGLVWIEVESGQIDFTTAMSDTNPCWFAVVRHVKNHVIRWPKQSVHMLSIMMAIAPWLVTVALGAWTLGRPPRESDILLHLLLAATVVVGISDWSMSPWGMIGPMIKKGEALPLPCLAQALMASTCGYLVAWGILQSGGSLISRAPATEATRDEADDDPDAYYRSLHLRLVHYFGRLLAWGLLAFVAYTGLMNSRGRVRYGLIDDQKEDAINMKFFSPRT
ncbi:MAG: hypothetical protein ACOX5G_02090 [Kiritimatiellia bacterium]|jgi:hypothetical protein